MTQYKYTDQEFDTESGLYNYNARLYDPALGRFISADSIVQHPFGPQTLNRYSYVGNNPLLYVDPSGHLLETIIVNAIVGGIISGTAAEASGGKFRDGFKQGAVAGAIFGAISGVGVKEVYLSGYGVPAGTYTYQSLSPGALAGINGAAGGLAGGINAEMYGGKFRDGFGVGATTGAVGSFGVPALEPFGDSKTASIPNRIFNSAVIGGGLGGASAALRGEDFWRGARRGAQTWALWETGNMIVGHGLGRAYGGKPQYENGVWIYYAEGKRPFSIGGAIVGDRKQLNGPTTSGALVVDHEIAHSYGKQKILGPAYLLGHLASQGISGSIGSALGDGFWLSTHNRNIFERYWHEYPDY